MSKKLFTILYLLSLVFFILIALASSTPQKTSTSVPNSNNSTPSLSRFQNAEFPKTARRCPSCLGSGCARCNYRGSVLE